VSHYGQEDFVTGHYGHPPRVQVWTKQLQPYLLAAVTMKLCVLIPITVPGISDLLIAFAHTILSVLSLDAQVIFVLAVFPTIMNVFQFCVVDQVIKAGKGTEQKTEHDSDYDLDDDEAMYRPLAVEEWANGPNGSGASPAGGTGVGPGGSGDNNGTPRLRGSAILNSRPSSRANSVTGSLPGSPRLAPEDAHLLGEYRKTGGLGLSGVERRDDEASVLFASSPVTSPTGAFATRRL
jgi:hypothetical protein